MDAELKRGKMERVRRVELPTLCLAKSGRQKAGDESNSANPLFFQRLGM